MKRRLYLCLFGFMLQNAGAVLADPVISNSISRYIYEHEKGTVELVSVIAERSWDAACVIEKGIDPVMIAKSRLGVEVTSVITPTIDEGLLDYLWKIAIVKGDAMAIYYFDERDIEFENLNACMSLAGATLSFGPSLVSLPSGNKFLARLSNVH
jgi:hypothetical protein